MIDPNNPFSQPQDPQVFDTLHPYPNNIQGSASAAMSNVYGAFDAETRSSGSQTYHNASEAYNALVNEPHFDKSEVKTRLAANVILAGLDLIPSVVDPSTLADVVSIANKATRGRFSLLEKLDTMPNVWTPASVGAVALELGTVVIPSSVVARGWQIARDGYQLFKNWRAERKQSNHSFGTNNQAESYPQPPAPNHDPYNLL